MPTDLETNTAFGDSDWGESAASLRTMPVLPSFLERRSDGAIVFRGHRITLHVYLEEAQGKSVSEIQGMFPTLSDGEIRAALQFWASARSTVNEYLGEQRELARENARLYPYTGPSVAELRQRRAARNSN